jgi:hypothetical protein
MLVVLYGSTVCRMVKNKNDKFSGLMFLKIFSLVSASKWGVKIHT